MGDREGTVKEETEVVGREEEVTERIWGERGGLGGGGL